MQSPGNANSLQLATTLNSLALFSSTSDGRPTSFKTVWTLIHRKILEELPNKISLTVNHWIHCVKRNLGKTTKIRTPSSLME